MSELPVDGVEHLRKVINTWDSDFQEDAHPLENLAAFLFLVDLHVAELRMFRSRIEQEIAKRAKTKLVEFPGGTAEIRAGAKRKNWDWTLLADAVVEAAMEQGESPKDALIDCVGVTPSHNWRVGALRKRGLNPDDYAEVSYGMPSVIVRADEKKEAEG